MYSEQRIVITGLGSISSLGQDTSTFWQAICNGACGIGPITTFDTGSLRQNRVAEVPNYQATAHFSAKEANRLDRYSEFGVIAAREAIQDSGLSADEIAGPQTAVIVGTGIGGEVARDAASQRLYRHNIPRAHPFTVPRIMPSAVASHITMDQGITGFSYVVSSACSSSNHAIIQAAMMIRYQQTEIAIAGGAEACLTYGDLLAWEALSVMDPEACRPFCLERKGMVLGEGAGMVLLESLEHALARGAKIYAEVLGYGMSADAGDLLHPSKTRVAETIMQALQNAKIAPDEVDYINAHGSGTTANDLTETQAIHQVFGDHAAKLMISSTKSMHGHAIGASSALELIATTLALQYSTIPPTINFLTPDPQCDLDYVPNDARSHAFQIALSNSFAFGGLNATIVLKKFNGGN